MNTNNTNKRKETILKVSKIVGNSVFYLFILLLLIFAIANIKVKTVADIPSIFGTGFLSVQSDSMQGDNPDSFNKGDMIFVEMLNVKKRKNLKLGDIITFYDGELRALNTHRIVFIDVVEGKTLLITQGDKVASEPNKKYDPNNIPDESYYEIVEIDDVLAKHSSTIAGAGTKLDYVQSPTGFALIIVLPTFLILIFEAVMLIRNFVKYNHSKLEEKYQKEKIEGLKDLEKEKEAMRQQLLEEIKKEQEAKKQ